jgi:hypothetical protein
MKMLFHHMRARTPILMGTALLTLLMDGFMLLYRVLGLSRAGAAYASLLTIVMLGSVAAQRYFKPHTPKYLGETDHA